MNREDDLLGQMYKSTPFVYVPPIAAKPHIDKRSVKLVYHNFSCCQIASGLWVCFVSVAAGIYLRENLGRTLRLCFSLCAPLHELLALSRKIRGCFTEISCLTPGYLSRRKVYRGEAGARTVH